METLIVHPENKAQLTAIKAFLKALKISFEKKDSENYRPEFVEMVKKAENNADYKTIDPHHLWESLQSK
jgi:ribosomal protein S20